MTAQTLWQPEPSETVSDEEFTVVYRSEFSYVWHQLRRLGVRTNDLADVAHDVFVTVYRRFGDYDRARPIRPWLFGIAYRHAAQYLRSKRNSRELVGQEPEAIDASPRADERLAAVQERQMIEEALGTLDLDRRAALIMHDFDQQPVSEIAAAMQVPVKTVYSRLRSAREMFIAAVRRIQRRQKER